MSLYKLYGTDANKESNGVDITLEANEDGSLPTFTVSRLGDTNKEFQKALRFATKPYERQIQLKTLPEEKDKEIYLDVFVSTILKGWQNVLDENGQPMAFNKANAKKLFTDLPDLYKLIQAQASDASLFRKASLEDEAKN